MGQGRRGGEMERGGGGGGGGVGGGGGSRAESPFTSRIVICGAGGLGLMALSLLKAMGGKGAIVVDIDARKREAAMAAAALATVDGKAPDALEQLTKAAGGPIRAVIDLVGNA